MTADIATQEKESDTNTMLPRLTLAFAVLTLFFALISSIFGIRLATLHSNSLKAEKQAVTSEAASVEAMENALKAAIAEREVTKQSLDAEKAAADRLRKQLSAVIKDLEKTKVNLAKANLTITGLKSTPPTEPTSSVESKKSVTAPSAKSDASQQPPGQPETQPTGDPVPQPVSIQSPGNVPAVNIQERVQKPAPEALTDDPESPADKIVAPVSSGVSSSVTEESLPDSPPESPAAAPTAQ